MVLKTHLASCLLVWLCWGLAPEASLKAQAPEQPSKKEMKLVKSLLEGEVQVLPMDTSPEATDHMEHFLPGDRIYLLRENGKAVAYLLATRALGRYDYFDYASLWTTEAVLLKVAVTTYRSNHGAAICQKRWLSQFENYQGESLQLGKDVDAVSGGTLSASSLIRDLQRSHSLIYQLIHSH